MKRRLTTLALTLLAQPMLAEELTGPALLSQIGGSHFDCLMGETPLQWVVSEVAPDATVVPYTATVRGKTVEAQYTLSAAGRLTSDGYGDERRVESNPEGQLIVTRSDGRAMTCTAR
ncbi:hypothetical protein [Shimia sp.]|uniref:hypothetical protein n=1 Tax=Shimia sp. TaxID=1954381 RepID=UPI003561A5E1